jgi:hypothetical protein
MSTRIRIGLVLLLLGAPGCGWSEAQVSEPGDPQAAEVVLAHWAALQKGQWKAAYDQLHPDLKADKRSLKRFTDLHARRLKAKGFPHDIKVVGSESTGDDVVVSFDVYAVPAGVGEPVAVSPRRRATLRKSGDSWGLMTHDILAVGP